MSPPASPPFTPPTTPRSDVFAAWAQSSPAAPIALPTPHHSRTTRAGHGLGAGLAAGAIGGAVSGGTVLVVTTFHGLLAERSLDSMDAAANLFGGLVLALILSTVAAAVGSVLGFVLGGFLGALLGATHLDSYAPALGVVAANLPVVVVAVPAISIGESLATAGEVATVIMIVTLLGGIGYLAGKQFANDMQQRLEFAT